MNKGVISDSFAKHFSKHFRNDKPDKNDQISSKDVREITRVSILWQGNPISSMKTFGRVNCNLCMMERLEILKAERIDRLKGEGKLINSSNEFYGACRHRTKFHRYRIFKNLISTDEGALSPKEVANIQMESRRTQAKIWHRIHIVILYNVYLYL